MNSWDLYLDKEHLSNELLGKEGFSNKPASKNSASENLASRKQTLSLSALGTQQSFEFSFVSPEKNSKNKKRKSVTEGKIESILPFSAWPVGELSEIRSKKEENIFHLLLPLLSTLSSQNRWITLISPPAGIDKKLFAYHGIDVSRVLLIHPKDTVDDTATMNKALKNGTSGIVILWTDRLATRFVAQWRKSVKQGDCRGVIVNHDTADHCSPSVALTLNVSSSDKAITITSTQKFGRKSNYRAKRSFPIVSLGNQIKGNQIKGNMNLGSFCLVN